MKITTIYTFENQDEFNRVAVGTEVVLVVKNFGEISGTITTNFVPENYEPSATIRFSNRYIEIEDENKVSQSIPYELISGIEIRTKQYDDADSLEAVSDNPIDRGEDDDSNDERDNECDDEYFDDSNDSSSEACDNCECGGHACGCGGCEKDSEGNNICTNC